MSRTKITDKMNGRHVTDTSQVSRKGWQEFVDKHEHGTVFHTPYIYDVYATTPNFTPFAFFCVDSKGGIEAMLSGYLQTVKPGILSGISTRSVMQQSPIYNYLESLKHLLDYYKKWASGKAVYTEIRNHIIDEDYSKCLQDCKFKWENHLNIHVDLTQSTDELWSQVHSKRRNEIRKAEKNGVTVRVIDHKDLYTAYLILKQVYDRARLPLLPFTFFELASELSSQGSGLVAYGAFFEDRFIGTMITLQFKGVVYDLFAGSLSEFYTKNPNDIIPWEVFKSSKINGYHCFDFGGAGKPEMAYGVRDYKLKFGGNMANYGRFHNIHKPLLYKTAIFGFKLLQKMKRNI
ncbi:MAG: GNAT family N-acetyltransferase [Candidatus Cloacimonas sp.]|nr:GNAT family N-acetyltransferase [Candidatus Cloacimonas sp.]